MNDSNSDQPVPSSESLSLRNPQVREFLWLCMPALVLGLVLRTLMVCQMPYGYMQFDSADFLVTANRFITKHALLIHSKRTFLVPILYTLPFILKIPALIAIPIAQHILGMGVILMTGLLTRLWSPVWRWIIVPLTLVMAANPNLLWFEHALMSESVYLFFAFALVLAATVYAQRQSNLRFVMLLTALFLTAGARPEGRLLLGFGFLLIVLTEWSTWKRLWLRLAWFFGLAIVTLPLTKTGQAGQLLYATVLPLAPDESKVDQGFGRQVLPLRDQIRAQGGVNTELQSLEQKLTEMTGTYLEARGARNPPTNAFCQKLAVEACLNQPWAVPVLAERKFLLSTRGSMSVGYSEPRMQEKLYVGFNRKNLLDTLSIGLVGQDLRGDVALSTFVKEHYRPFSWYPYLDEGWRKLTLGKRGESDLLGRSAVPTLPIFFFLSLAGMAIVLATPGSFQRLHFAWLLCLAGLWFAVELTGVVNPRYRFVFEPFCLIYAIHGLGSFGSKVASGFRALARQTDSGATPQMCRARER